MTLQILTAKPIDLHTFKETVKIHVNIHKHLTLLN